MGLNDALLAEFDQEMSNTRKILERVPDDKLDWRPHPKSMTVKQLALHLALFPSWATEIFDRMALDIAPPGQPPYQPPVVNSHQEMLEIFDRDLAKARIGLEGSSDRQLLENWTLLAGGKTIFAMPRIAALRAMVLNHMIHHRAQFGLYLRLNDLPVPGFYGPSADEANF